MTKKDIRQEVTAKIKAMPQASKDFAHRKLAVEFTVLLRNLLDSKTEPLVMAYWPLKDEPDIRPILEFLDEGDYRLCLPFIRTDGVMEAKLCETLSTMKTGKFNIPCPDSSSPTVEPNNIQLILVPGRAFTRDGKRLGRGKGFYDKFLPITGAKRVALAYRCQMYSDLPTEEHDQTVHKVIAAGGP